ncbi:MAG: hypothetical protein EAZ20_16170 [Bacteroidetes bacterium]|nr:MAG: hypothetical protein EAZ20_16170 [Bacteroidota bacterium]
MEKIIFAFLLIFLFACQKNENIKIEFQKQDYVDKSLKYKISLMKINNILYNDCEPVPITKKYLLDGTNYAFIDLEKHLSHEDYFRTMKYNPNISQWFYNFTTIDTNTINSCFISIIDYNYTYIYKRSRPYYRHYRDNYVMNLIKKHCDSNSLCNYEHYPMILLNKNCNLDSLYVGDNFLCVQEALDKDGIWKPINRLADYSQDPFYSLKFKKREFIIILLPKYEGDFETKLRVRWRNGKKVYISNSFIGKINRNFLLEKKDILFCIDKERSFDSQKNIQIYLKKRFLGNEFAIKLIDETVKEQK